MGLLSFVEAPIKDIINGLTAPIEEVERIFGTVITITEDIIKQFVSLLEQMDNLFNSSTFTSIFITPFKSAVLLSVNGLQDLTSLIFSYGTEGFTDVTETLEQPINDLYKGIKSSVADLSNAYTAIINGLTPEPTRILDSSLRDVRSFISRIEDDVQLIKNDITTIFQVVHADGIDVTQEFVSFAKAGVSDIQTDINVVGSKAIQGVDAFLTSAQNRMKNENSAIDTFILVIIGSMLIGVISLLIATGSLSLLVAAILILGIALLTIYLS